MQPIITDDVPDDKSYSTADSVIVDSVHSPVLKKPATDTQAAKSVGVHPEPGYVGELAGKLEKRPQTEGKREEFSGNTWFALTLHVFC